MESWQTSYIQRNLDYLIRNTTCSSLFLAALQRDDILSRNDVSMLDAKRDSEGQFAQSKMLYEIAMTRKGAYKALVEALRETIQTGSLVRLEEASADNPNVIFEFKDITISTRWKELSAQLKKNLESKRVAYQGKHVQLKELSKQYDLRNVDGGILTELAKGEIPCVVNTQVPDKLEYYVERTVKSRARLSQKVFKSSMKDVFVIEGVEKHQISSLVALNELTDVSGNQIRRVTVRFIHLECEEDYERICQRATVPVHRVRCVENVFELVASSGSVENLQTFVDESQGSCIEHELISNTNKVCLISDSPGMGKTCLLANIAHHILKSDSLHLVRYIVLNEFVKRASKVQISVDSVVKIIAEQSSTYRFGRKLVENVLRTQPCVFIIDGFDEVLSQHTKVAKKILQKVLTMRSARIFVATRPHFRTELENTLNILGNTIQPFNQENQVTFLLKFWDMKGATVNDSLTQFAKLCLTEFNAKMTDFEREIAEIPLMCKLLAETYETQARRCSKLGFEAYKNSHSNIIINSMFEMYETHIKMQFQKISRNKSWMKRFANWVSNRKSRYQAIKHAHVYYALKLLFPLHADQFKELQHSSISLADLCGRGLLEATNTSDIRFVHRTFAEYLVAWFAVEGGNRSGTSKAFILFEVLRTKSLTFFYDDLQIPSCRFVFPVICYFLNGFSYNHNNAHTNEDRNPSPASLINSNVHDKIAPIFMASAFHNLPHIPAAIVRFLTLDTGRASSANPAISFRNILFVTAANADRELMEVLWEYECVKNVTMESDSLIVPHVINLTPLHVAVEKGKYKLVEYLVKKYDRELINLQFLFHFCVFKSLLKDDDTVRDKIQILKLLSSKSNRWVNELHHKDNATPLLRTHVHPKLMECLINELGADVNVCDVFGDTVAHKISDISLEPQSYHRVIVALSDHNFQHFDKENSDDYGRTSRTPLHCAVENIELLEETIKLFHFAGVNFNKLDELGDSVLFYGIRGGRSVKFIQELIKAGADFSHCNCIRECALHICAKNGNFDALKYFIETYNMDVNAETNDSFTPLHYAARKANEEHEKICTLLINKGANVNVSAFNRTPFMEAFVCGEGLSMNVIELMEQKGLQISPEVASQALKSQLLYQVTVDDNDWEKECQRNTPVLAYLIEKGGRVDFEFTTNIWKWKTMKTHLPEIITHTEITSTFLSRAKMSGLLTEEDMGIIKQLSGAMKSEQFYQTAQEKDGSLEQIYKLLTVSKQFKPIKPLMVCFKAAGDKLRSSIFVTSPPGVEQFIQSQSTNLFVLLTKNCELTIKRIQETVDENCEIINEHDELTSSFLNNDKLGILKGKILNQNLMEKLLKTKKKIIYVANNLSENMEKFEVQVDTWNWNDISSYLIDKMWFSKVNAWNITDLFASPNILAIMGQRAIMKFKKFKDNQVSRIVDVTFGHTINQDTHMYLSSRIFHYFLPDKLVYKSLTMEEMRGFAKYGHKIGKFEEDIDALDYVLIEESDQFLEICKGTSISVHLIEHHEGRFRLMNTRGSDKNLRKYFESTKLCSDFPHCNCEVDNLILRFSFSIYKDELLTCEINVSELLPKMLELLKLQDSIDFYQLKCCLKSFQKSSVSTTTLRMDSRMKLDELKSAPFDQQIVQLVECISDCLPTSEWVVLMRSSVSTLFPQLLTGSVSRMAEYKESYTLRGQGQETNQMNETLGFYFIANLIMKQETVDYVSVRDLTLQLFTNCFEPIKHHISCRSWGNSMYHSASIKSFKFSNKRLFQFLNSLAKSHIGMISISKIIKEYITHLTVDKWVHAFVNGNLFDLLTLVIGFEKHGKRFESDELVVLAVAHADVPVIELVAKHYEKTSKKVSDIQLKLIRDTFGLAGRFPATLLHVAALRGNYSVIEKLLESYEFKSMLNLPHIKDIICCCICDTQKSQDQVKSRIKIIDKLLQFNPALIHSPNLQTNNPILVSNSHADLIMHLINLGCDIHATDDGNENVTHVSARYMSPLEYDKLINFIYETGAVEIFHSKDKSLETPLHKAVKCFEALDSTLDLFTSANVDFNETTKVNNTVLHLATQFQKHASAHLLDSLVQAGADFNKQCGLNLNVSVLHMASQIGNLTALRYFIAKGIDVNIRGLKNTTPLFYAITLSKQKVEVIFRTLVQYGADLNTTDKLLRTPLSYALEWNLEDVDSDTIEFLKSSGAQVFPNIVNVKVELERWYTDNIIKNVENLTETTAVSGEFENGGQKFLTYQEIEQLKRIGSGTNGLEKPYLCWPILEALLKTNQTEIYKQVLKRTSRLSYRLKQLLDIDVEYWNYDVVEYVVKMYPEIVHSRDTECRTTLHRVLMSRNEKQLKLIKMLISHNADVNARDAEDNSTPIHYSVRQNLLPPHVIDIIKLLIENGADPDAVDDDGRTFLHWAPSFFTPQLYHELVTYFDSIGRKKSWKMVTSHSFTHLHFAVIKFEPLVDTLKIFKMNDINFNAQDNDGDSVMFDAIEAGRSAEFLQTLFTFGADWRVPNKKQENALHIAALTGNLSALKLFISLDCDVNATNKFGYTPLHNVFLGHFDDKREAPCMADHEIVEQLLMNGADINVKDNDGNLAIDLARDRWKMGTTENHTLKLLETYQAI